MSSGSNHEEQTAGDGAFPATPGTAAAAHALLAVQNTATDQESDGNHEPGTRDEMTLAASGGQGGGSSTPTLANPTLSMGVSGVPPAAPVVGTRSTHMHANTPFPTQGTRVPIYSPHFNLGLGAGATQARDAMSQGASAPIQNVGPPRKLAVRVHGRNR